MKKEKIKFTYEKGRKCEYCGEPIADLIHENRKHCLPVVFDDGTIKDCKVDKNNEKAAIKSKEVRSILEMSKQLLERVKKLVALKGNTVTTEDLNLHNISLNDAIKIDKMGKKVILSFRGFKITTFHWENKHIIELN